MELLIAFLFGSIIGSFLNVCIYRIPRGESIAFPSSHCPQCNYPLKIWDLIPVFSYLYLKGCCRKCGGKISSKYPFIELLSGIIFTLVVFKEGFNFTALFYCLFLACLIVIAFIDLEHFLIPNSLVLALIILGIGLHIVVKPFNPLNGIASFFGAGGFFLFLQILSRGGMGGGDIKLTAALGLWLGWPDIALTIFLGSFIGIMIFIPLILLKIKNRRDFIPYGPFLVLGALIIFFAGEKIWLWYINLIF